MAMVDVIVKFQIEIAEGENRPEYAHLGSNPSFQERLEYELDEEQLRDTMYYIVEDKDEVEVLGTKVVKSE